MLQNKIVIVIFHCFQVSEDTKTNVSELQQKLLKVTSDNEDRIKQFQDKLSKVYIYFFCGF